MSIFSAHDAPGPCQAEALSQRLAAGIRDSELSFVKAIPDTSMLAGRVLVSQTEEMGV